MNWKLSSPYTRQIYASSLKHGFRLPTKLVFQGLPCIAKTAQSLSVVVESAST
jgi:hypothetical protein